MPTDRPPAICWAGLDPGALALITSDMARLTSALTTAREAGDDALLRLLQATLLRHASADSHLASRLIAEAATLSASDAETIFAALRDSDAVKNGLVTEDLLRVAREHPSLDHRALALGALEGAGRLSAPELKTLAGLATEPAVAWSATRAIGRVMANDFNASGTYAPYLQELVGIARATDDPALRYLAIEMVTYAEPDLTTDFTGTYIDLLLTGADAGTRLIAALALVSSPDHDVVLAAYADSFAAEPDVCFRWALVNDAFRAAGGQALPWLHKVTALDPRFRDDLGFFEKTYAGGAVDFDRVSTTLDGRHMECAAWDPQ